MLILQYSFLTRNTQLFSLFHTYLYLTFYIKTTKYLKRVKIFNETGIDIYSKLHCAVTFEGMK